MAICPLWARARAIPAHSQRALLLSVQPLPVALAASVRELDKRELGDDPRLTQVPGSGRLLFLIDV